MSRSIVHLARYFVAELGSGVWITESYRESRKLLVIVVSAPSIRGSPLILCSLPAGYLDKQESRVASRELSPCPPLAPSHLDLNCLGSRVVYLQGREAHAIILCKSSYNHQWGLETAFGLYTAQSERGEEREGSLSKMINQFPLSIPIFSRIVHPYSSAMSLIESIVRSPKDEWREVKRSWNCCSVRFRRISSMA